MANDLTPAATGKPRRAPWNKGKLAGAKPPLRPSHVWSIRTKQDRQQCITMAHLPFHRLNQLLQRCTLPVFPRFLGRLP